MIKKLLAAVLLVAAPVSAQALDVSPVIFDMTTAGKFSSRAIVVRNPGSRELGVELDVRRLDLTQSGEAVRSEGGDENFLIFPPQAIIPAGGVQNFRVQWVGDPQLAESESYTFTVRQIPVDLSDGASEGATEVKMNIVFAVATTGTVTAAAGEAQITSVEGVGAVRDGENGVAFTVENLGAKHEYLRNADLRFSAEGWSERLREEEVAQFVPYGLILPGHKRDFFLPMSDAPQGQPVTVEVSFD